MRNAAGRTGTSSARRASGPRRQGHAHLRTATSHITESVTEPLIAINDTPGQRPGRGRSFPGPGCRPGSPLSHRRHLFPPIHGWADKRSHLARVLTARQQEPPRRKGFAAASARCRGTCSQGHRSGDVHDRRVCVLPTCRVCRCGSLSAKIEFVEPREVVDRAPGCRRAGAQRGTAPSVAIDPSHGGRWV